MFKRRNPLTWLQWLREGVYPRAGWRRVFEYIVHRIKRVPDSPHRISVGVAIGVFITFTPFFGLHFLLAALLAVVLRGNVIVALIATFFGNPITFPIIGILSHRLGMAMMDRPMGALGWDELRQGLGDLFLIPWRNFKAIFTDATADWTGYVQALDIVFFPYLLGGLIPGLVFGALGYFLSKPLVVAYQNRRKGRFTQGFKNIRSQVSQRIDRRKEEKDDT